MTISLWELQSNLSLEDATSSTEGTTRRSETIYVKEKVNTRVIYYVVQ